MNKSSTADWPEIWRTKIVEEFLAEQGEILRHKWFESEKAGRDVGYEYARMDWVLRHRERWGNERAGVESTEHGGVE